MKKRTKFYALLFAMVLSLTQIIGVAVPVKQQKRSVHMDILYQEILV